MIPNQNDSFRQSLSMWWWTLMTSQASPSPDSSFYILTQHGECFTYFMMMM